MGKWSKSLPEPMSLFTDRTANALWAISYSLDKDIHFEARTDKVRRAAAEVRAWRKSLDGEWCREDATGTGDVRACLRWAAKCVLWADEGGGVIRTREEYLRRAEAYLREAARLLTEQIEGAE